MSRTSMTGMSEWKKSKEVAKLAKKKPKNDNKDIGLVDLQVEYDNAILKVTVKRMQNLKKMDVTGASDPFAWVYLIRSDKPNSDNILVEKGHEKTVTKKNEANPNFMEEFKFAGIDWNELQSYKICISVYDWDRFTGDDFMGGVTIPASFLYQNMNKLEVQFTVPLLGHDLNNLGHPLAITQDSIGFYGSNMQTSKTSLSSPVVPPPKASPRPARKKSTLTVGSINIIIEYLHGSVLRVFVDRCENLKDEDAVGKSDPYVKVYLLNNDKKVTDTKEQTRTIKNDLNPRFEEYFEFKMTEVYIRSSYMVIEVWDDDKLSRDDPIGGVRFSLEHMDLTIQSSLKLSLFQFARKEKPKLIILETKVVPMAQFVSQEVYEEEYIAPVAAPPIVKEDCWMGEANDRFVRYITNMQILKDAKLNRGRFDNEIQLTETVRQSYSREKIDIGQVNISFQELIKQEKEKNRLLMQQKSSLTISLREWEGRISEYEASLARKRSEYGSMRSRVIILEEELSYLKKIQHDWPVLVIPTVPIGQKHVQKDYGLHFAGQHGGSSSTESRISINVPIKITDRIRIMLTAHLEEVRKGFVPHFTDWQVEIRQIVAQIQEYESKIHGLRLYHPEMDKIIASYRDDLRIVTNDISGVRGDVTNLHSIINGQDLDFGNRKQSLSMQFEKLYMQLEESLNKRGSNFGHDHKKLMTELLEMEIYNYLLHFEENRIRAAEDASGGLGPDGDRAKVLIEEITLDRQQSEYRESGRVSSSVRSSSAYIIPNDRRSRSSSSDNETTSRRTSTYSNTAHTTVRETGRFINSSNAGVYLGGTANSRRTSGIINQSGGMYSGAAYTGYNAGGAGSVVRGEVANSMAQKGPPLREYPSTSGYATSPGPLSPGSPLAPTPGSPSFSSPRDSNISNVFSNLRPEIEDSLL